MRMLLLPESTMCRFPDVSNASPDGEAIAAFVAGPPSPPEVELPLPATVVMFPDEALIIRIRLLYLSEIYRFPGLSNASPDG